MPSQAYANYAMGPLHVSFSFTVEPPTDSLCHMLVSNGVCFLLSGPHMAAMFTSGAQPLGFVIPKPFGVYHWQAYMLLGHGPWPMPGMHLVAALPTG